MNGNGGFDRRTLLRGSMLAGLGILGAGSLAGCSGGDSDKLILAYNGDATQQKAFQALFDEFQKQHPKIQMKATGIAAGDWGTFANTVSTQIAGGKKFDVVDVATEGQLLLASKKVLEPLDSLIAKDSDVTDEFFAAIPEQLGKWTKTYGSPDGKTYYIPGGYNTVGMYLNKEVFSDAGVELPETDWTWDDFRSAAEQVKVKTGAYFYAAGYGFPFQDILPWLLTNGTSTLNDDWNKCLLGDDAAIEAATFLKDLIADGLSPKPGGEFDAPTQFARGKLAAMPGGRYTVLDINRIEMTDKTRVVNFPSKVSNGTPVGWDGWPIFADSEKQDDAWVFLKWMMSPESSQFYAEHGGTNVPVRREVAESKEFLANAPEGSELIGKAIEFGTPIPSPAQGAKIDDVITSAWQAAILGTKDVAEALTAASKKVDALL